MVRQRRFRIKRHALISFFLVAAFVVGLRTFVVTHLEQQSHNEDADTLVVYLAGYSDPEHHNNVNYFLKYGVK
jgi:hypothetical protein